VAGVIRSDEPQDQNVAYVHLDFLQFASGSRSGGIVTQFNVRVDDPSQLERSPRRSTTIRRRRRSRRTPARRRRSSPAPRRT
jgi:putative ABC transport system permease protein